MKNTRRGRLRCKRKVDGVDRRRGSRRPPGTALERRLNACAQIGEHFGATRIRRDGDDAGWADGKPGQLALQRHRSGNGTWVQCRPLLHRRTTAGDRTVEHVVQHVLHPHRQRTRQGVRGEKTDLRNLEGIGGRPKGLVDFAFDDHRDRMESRIAIGPRVHPGKPYDLAPVDARLLGKLADDALAQRLPPPERAAGQCPLPDVEPSHEKPPAVASSRRRSDPDDGAPQKVPGYLLHQSQKAFGDPGPLHRMALYRRRGDRDREKTPVMKLVTFRTDAHDRAGILSGDRVIDLENALAWFEHTEGRRCDCAHVVDRYGRGVLGFIEHSDRARPAADAIVREHTAGRLPPVFDSRILSHAFDEVSLRAPLPHPPSLRDGYAFRQHVEAARRNRGLAMIPEYDDAPVFYFGNHHAVVGPGEVRARGEQLRQLDYELEAAIVVGKTAENLTATDADEAIFGMTIMNDWSARALQMHEMKLSLGPAKGKDFATSLGPWLVTLDELLPRATRTERGLVFDLAMRATVNGATLSRGNLKDMHFTFAQILERASYGATLVPGDVIGSGTCGTGCLLELNGSKATNDLWLEPGDIVVLEIEGLGALENRVVDGA